jgi:hypothetical protein
MKTMMNRNAGIMQSENQHNHGSDKMIALLVWYEDHLSLIDLGKRLDRDPYSLSQAADRLRKPMETNLSLGRVPDRLLQGLAEIHISQAPSPQKAERARRWWPGAFSVSGRQGN